MNKSLIAAAALFGGVAIAAPLAWSADEPQTGQPLGGMREHGGMGMMDGMRHRDGMGPMRPQGGMREMMMRHMMHVSPQQRCEERLARRAAVVAYAGSKLKLTAEQRPLWDKLEATLRGVRDRQQQFCDSLKPSGDRGQATVLDRANRADQYLSTQLDALHQIRPALEDLYRALTQEQKSVIDRIGMHG